MKHDKKLHLIAGVILGAIGVTITMLPPWGGAVLLAATIGAGKEIWDDYTGLGTPEYMDFIYTITGGAIIAVIALIML